MAKSLRERMVKELRELGVSEEELRELEDWMKRKGLFDLIDKVISELEDLDALLKVVSDVKGLRNEVYEYRYKIEVLTKYLSEELYALLRDKNRDKRARELSQLLKGMIDEITESRHRILTGLKDLLINELNSSRKPDELLKEVNGIDSLQSPSELRKLIERLPAVIESREEELKQRDLRKIFAKRKIVEELGPYAVTDKTLDDLLLLMMKVEDLRRNLDEKGVDYMKLSEFSSIERDLALFLASYIGKKTYLKISSPYKYMRKIIEEGTLLNQLVTDLANKSVELDDVKERLYRKLIERGLEDYADLVKLVGIGILKPSVVFDAYDIEILEEEVQKSRKLLDLLTDLMAEVDRSPRDLKIPLREFPLEREEEFIRSLINTFRVARLSRDLPTPVYSPSEIVKVILDLYPKWRRYVIKALEKKGSLSVDELDFIPKVWRKWFLNNLSEEGIAELQGNKIVPKLPMHELFKRVEMKIEVLRDKLEYLGDYVDLELDQELLQSFEEKFKKAKELSLEGKLEEALTILKELNSKLDEALSERKEGEEINIL
ncbi:MAG TPA: hypothetical protein ENF57_03035 [Candidatus Korarchaeota archaeon]|nr:hypothetical protein [Candidatus Korarchaeota archaeon]